jgi:hypothetical protein
LIHEALATSAAASLSADAVSISDVPSVQVGSEIKGDIPVLDQQGDFTPPAFQIGSEHKLDDVPVFNDGEFLPPALKEGSEIKGESPPFNLGEFLPPGVIPKKVID